MINPTRHKNITITQVSNGYIITINRSEHPEDMFDRAFNKMQPMLENLKNKITGDEWKNEKSIDEQLQEIIARGPEPYEVFVFKTWTEVINKLKDISDFK